MIIEEQNLCKDIIFQLQSMSNAIICVDKSFVGKNSGIVRLALIFNFRNQRMTILHAKRLFTVAKYGEAHTFW